MIIENGKIQFLSVCGGGIVKGIPHPAVEIPEEPVTCCIKVNKDDHHGKADGSIYRQANMTVIIDAVITEEVGSRRAKLFDTKGREIGVFRVQNVQYLDYVQAIELQLTHAD